MGYEVEILPQVEDEIRRWNRPEEIIREFYLKLSDAAHSDRFLDQLYENDPTVYEYTVTVEESRGRAYVFSLHMWHWSDHLFRVIQCSAFCVENGKVVWSSP